MRTLFFVQPYVSRRGRLVASGAASFEDAADAVAAGKRIARFRPGVVVLSQRLNDDTGDLGRPEIIEVLGRVPEAWRELPYRRHGQAA